MNGTHKKIDIRLALLLSLGGLALSLLVLSGSALGSITGDQPPLSGDWVIDNPTTVRGEMITVDGNLIINDVLMIDTSTITMDLAEDGATEVNVTSTGKLVMTGSTITSIDPNFEYFFIVIGEMDVKRSTLAECHMGIAIRTNKTVLLQDSNILESTGRGLYLKDADGTTVKNCNIHSDDFGVELYYEFNFSYDGQRENINVNLVPLQIDGGDPTIEGLDISVNGTTWINSSAMKNCRYNYAYFYVYFYGALIDSEDITDISNMQIFFHDSTVQVSGFHFVNNTYTITTNPYCYYYTYSYIKGLVLGRFSEIDLGGFKVDNIVSEYPDIQTDWTGEQMNIYSYNYFYGMDLYYAFVDYDFGSAGPHDLKINLRDLSFTDTSILTFELRMTYSGSQTPTFNIEMNIDNITVDGSSDYELFYFYLYPQFTALKIFNVDIRITNSTFTNIDNGRVLYNYIQRGTGLNTAHTFEITQNIIVENCVFRDCKLGYYDLFYDYAYNYNELNNRRDRTLTFRNNTFDNIDGDLLYLYGGTDVSRGLEWVIVEDNVFKNINQPDYGYLLYINGFERQVVRNNLFIDVVSYYGSRMGDNGGSIQGVKPVKFWVLNNTFLRCTQTYDYYYYGFLTLYGGWDAEIAYNNVTDCSRTFLSVDQYLYYAPSATVNFHHNTITEHDGAIVYMSEYGNYQKDLTLNIHDNVAWNCSGKFVDYYEHSYQNTYDYDPTVIFTNIEITNFTGVVFSSYGDIIVSDNTISECEGYVFELQYLNMHVPTISRNDISDCVNVYYISAKSKGSLKISITMSDLEVKCTGNGFKFENVDMTLINVNISDEVGLGIIAENSNVDLVDSLMPIGSGRIIGDGSINVWFNIEASVYWKNSMGEDSNQPVQDAWIIFTGSQGLYYASSFTDENGHMRPKRILNWNMDGPFVTLWSPYTVTIAKSGMSNTSILELDRSYVGENAAEFLLWDTSAPYVRLVSPFPDVLISTENLTIRGFATELGSGIHYLNISINDMEPEPLEMDENGDFVHTFYQVLQGDIVITAKVEDVSTNSYGTSLSLRIDRMPPTIRILDPPRDHVTNQRSVLVRAEIEEGAMVVINGEEWGTSPGTISVDFPLSEGINTILIEATDEAGNMAFDIRTVFRDTIDPSLSLFAPRDMSLTRMTNVTVEGEAEVGSTVLISVEREDFDLVDEVVTPDENGMFSHGVDLSEGVNKIIVRAIDRAENEMKLSRTVIVDTTAPECGIDEPENGLITNQETVTVKGWAETGDVLVYLNGKQIFSTGQIERIVRLHEGENTITLSAVDTIGNEESHTVMVIMDSKAPVIQISTPVDTFIRTNMPNVRIVGKVSGDHDRMTANDVEVTLEDGAFDINVPVNPNVISDIVLTAYDVAGNMVIYTLTVDHSTQAPMLIVEYYPHGPVIRTEEGNLYITGTTTELVTTVEVSHESDLGSTSHTYSVRQAQFSMVMTLEKGDNSVILTVTDIYGNSASAVAYQVEYDPPKVTEETDDDVTIEPQNLGLVLLVIAITVFVTAVIVTRSFKAKRE